MCKQNQVEEVAQEVKAVMEKYLRKDEHFTGKIVFTLNCRGGGIGNLEAHIQKKIDG